MEGLGINLPVLISQLVSFLVLFIILRFVAYKRILKILDDRAQRIKESLEQAEAAKEQSLQAQDEVKKEIQAASKQGQEIIARASQAGDEVRKKAQELAKQDAEALIQRARQEIKAERDEAIDVLRSQFADLTIKAASKVLGESLDEESHKELIDKVLQESQTLNKG